MLGLLGSNAKQQACSVTTCSRRTPQSHDTYAMVVRGSSRVRAWVSWLWGQRLLHVVAEHAREQLAAWSGLGLGLALGPGLGSGSGLGSGFAGHARAAPTEALVLAGYRASRCSANPAS